MSSENTNGPRVHPEILQVKPYVAGAPSIPGMRAKLNSNEGAFGPPPAARQAMAEAAMRTHRYPDGSDTELRHAIGAYYGLDPDLLVCSAGSDRIIGCLIAAYGGPGTEMICSQHTFYEYERASVVAGAKVVKVPERGLQAVPRDFAADVDAMLAAVTPRTTLLFLANPDNPTGSFLPAEDLRRLRAGLPPQVVLVLDSAYGEFVTRDDYDVGTALVDACMSSKGGQGDNTVMVRTFSKMWGLAGERIGWCYAPAAMVDVLNRVRDPFNISVSATSAAIAALQEPGWQDRAVAHNTEHRARLADRLRQAGLHVFPSEANFLLIGFRDEAQANAAHAFLREQGVLVRAMTMYELPDTMRITIGPENEVALAAEMLTRFMQDPRFMQDNG